MEVIVVAAAAAVRVGVGGILGVAAQGPFFEFRNSPLGQSVHEVLCLGFSKPSATHWKRVGRNVGVARAICNAAAFALPYIIGEESRWTY